jgi:hypothetical protein
MHTAPVDIDRTDTIQARKQLDNAVQLIFREGSDSPALLQAHSPGEGSDPRGILRLVVQNQTSESALATAEAGRA